MSIVCAAIKDNQVAIACDTQTSFGSRTVTAQHKLDSCKLHHVKGSVIGVVGWGAMSTMLRHAILTKPKLFKLSNCQDIYKSLLKLHRFFKNNCYLETNEDSSEQPVESSQLNALIINQHGIFDVGSYREISQFKTYWAIGSGADYALGAMNALYQTPASAYDLVSAGVYAAAEFDDGCALPLHIEVIDLYPQT